MQQKTALINGAQGGCLRRLFCLIVRLKSNHRRQWLRECNKSLITVSGSNIVTSQRVSFKSLLQNSWIHFIISLKNWLFETVLIRNRQWMNLRTFLLYILEFLVWNIEFALLFNKSCHKHEGKFSNMTHLLNSPF